MPKPLGNTGKKPKKNELGRWLAETQPERIGEPEFAHLMQTLAPISASYLRKLLRESGTPLTPVIEGVRQSNLDELSSTLAGLLDEYLSADPSRRRLIRSLVITAKDHARFAARRQPDKRLEKEEMILWMVTWLENPALFPDWVRLRRQHLSGSSN